MQQVAQHEVVFHPLSYQDPNGRLFWWKGELCRGIYGKLAPLYTTLFEEGIVQQLVEGGYFVETEPLPVQIEGFDMVLRHRKIPFVSYAFEWCAPMLRDAALAVLDVELILARHGLTLQDAHPWNVLFDGPRPVWIDFCSIVPAEPDSAEAIMFNDELHRYFVYPLYLMAGGHTRIARWLLHDFDLGVTLPDLLALTHRLSLRTRARALTRRLREAVRQHIPESLRPGLRQMRSTVRSVLTQGEWIRAKMVHLQRVRAEVAQIAVSPLEEPLSDMLPSSGDREEVYRKVHRLLTELRPTTILDVHSKDGRVARLAAQQGSRVVALDTDEARVARLYATVKREDLPVLPLVMDIRNPSPGYGIANEWLTPATERLPCDLVLCLDYVHELVYRYAVTFDQIARGLSAFARRWVLVEFIAPEDASMADWELEKYPWYSLEHFVRALEEHFSHVECLSLHSPDRVLFLCEC